MCSKSITDVFGIMIAVAVQSVFRLEMHPKIFFFYFFKLFLTSTHQNNMKI
jgi:hypothetical protein